MATSPKVPPITIEQYEHFEGYPGLRDELIYGEIVMSPQPKPLHQQTARNIERLLDNALGEDSQYVARQNSNIKFAKVNSMPAPDVFVVLKKDWLAACENDVYLVNPPALAVEVISRANRPRRVEQKVDLYLDHGVLQVWVVNPKKQTLFVHDRAHPKGVQAMHRITSHPLIGEIAVEPVFRLL
jgi:Uma2 family endonuclease